MTTAVLAPPAAFTQTVRSMLAGPLSPSAIDDLLFLEAWERDPAPGLGAVRRAGQIRRANPAVAAAIRSEIAARSHYRVQ